MIIANSQRITSSKNTLNANSYQNDHLIANTLPDPGNSLLCNNNDLSSSYRPQSSLNTSKYSKTDFYCQNMGSNKKGRYLKKQTYSSPSDIYYPNNYKKSNAKVLSKILDSKRQFAPNSPSHKQIIQRELQGFEMLNPSEDNDHYYLLNSLGFFLQISDKDFELLDVIEERLLLIMEIISEPSIQNNDPDKTDDYREQDKMIKLGGLITFYLLLKKYWEQIDNKVKDDVLRFILNLLKNYETYDELFLVSCLDICSLYSRNSISLDNIDLLSMFITDFNYPKLQRACFNCLMSLQEEGIKMLIELSSKDYQDHQTFILQHLLDTPHIQKMIIVRALINDIFCNNYEKRISALSALSRMKYLVNDPKLLTKINGCFNAAKIRKGFIASILRTSGEVGEKMLIDQLTINPDPAVKMAILNVLSYRLKKHESYLQMRLDSNDTYSVSKKLPGVFCNYHGIISPYIDDSTNTNTAYFRHIFDTEDKDPNTMSSFTEYELSINKTLVASPIVDNVTVDEYLEVSTRDFLSSLQRMLLFNFEQSIKDLNNQNNCGALLDSINIQYSNNDFIMKYTNLFTCKDSETDNENNIYYGSNSQIMKNREISQDYYPISNNVIRAIAKCFKDPNPKVREEAVIALGMIALPEGIEAIEALHKTLSDSDSNVKAKVLWAIGRLCPCSEVSEMIPSIIQCINHNMWKVKRACFYCLGKIGEQCSDYALPILLKELKETPINKHIITEAIVSLGERAETALLKLISSEPDSNFKLKSAITRALGYVDIYSNNIDFIIECLFRQSQNMSSQVRYSAIFAINLLSRKSNEQINYLRKKNVIPYYYDKLKDKDNSVRQYAANCLKNYGPQGELIFIEGLMKDPNPIVRQYCGVSLAEMGVHTIRTTIIGLHDTEESVRKAIEKAIINKMPNEAVLSYFTKENQLLSLKVSIQDLFDKNIILCQNTKTYFNTLLNQIEKKYFGKLNHH